MATTTDYAWAAGLFDGEGCICIERLRPQRRSGDRSVKFRFRIRVGMTTLAPIERLRQLFGFGSIFVQTPCNRKTKYTWSCQSEKAASAVTLMLPYFVVKSEEAKLGLQFMEFQRLSVPVSNGCRGASYSTLKQRQQFYERMLEFKVSKKRGFKPIPLEDFETLSKIRNAGINQKPLLQ